MNLLDTIAAVSTPYGKGGVALIRISGEDAIMIADRVFRSASGRKLADAEHAKMLYGEIFMPQDRDREGALSLDDVMAVAFLCLASLSGSGSFERNSSSFSSICRSLLSINSAR